MAGKARKPECESSGHWGKQRDHNSSHTKAEIRETQRRGSGTGLQNLKARPWHCFLQQNFVSERFDDLPQRHYHLGSRFKYKSLWGTLCIQITLGNRCLILLKHYSEGKSDRQTWGLLSLCPVVWVNKIPAITCFLHWTDTSCHPCCSCFPTEEASYLRCSGCFARISTLSISRR